MRPTPGTKLGGRYQLVEFIAQGGMGEVWKAQDLTLERIVAVKFLKLEHGESREHLARFQREARVLAALDHPGIARGIDAGQEQGANYLVMEFVPGETLSALLKEWRFDVSTSLALLIEVSEALSAAHGQGFVHRDVKPGNILISPDGMVKVTDFGIASNVSDTRLTVTGQVIGTPQYISPEQALGSNTTAASDIYALGAIIYECLAGRPLFSGLTPMAVAIEHINSTPPPLPPTVPAELRRLVMSMLSKDPSGRPPSASEIAKRAQEINKKISATTSAGADEQPTAPFANPRQTTHSDKVVKLTTPFTEVPMPSQAAPTAPSGTKKQSGSKATSSSKRSGNLDIFVLLGASAVILAMVAYGVIERFF